MAGSALIERLFDVIENDIVPLTEIGVARGNKLFGAAILRKSDRSLWARRADLSAPEHVVLSGPATPPGDTTGIWSPGGRTMFFGGSGPDPRGGQDIWQVSVQPEANGSTRIRPWLQTPASEAPAAFSPDGRWLAYFSNVSKPDDLYLQPFPGPGAVLRVTSHGASRPVNWNEQELFYQSNSEVMAVSIGTQPGLAVGVPKTLFKIPAGLRYAGVSRDGRRFLFLKDYTPATPDPPPTEMIVVVNWIDQAKQRMSRGK